VSPLDGGRAAAAIHPVLWLVGLVGLIALTIVAPNPILIIVLLFGGMDVWQRWKTRNHPELQAYYRIAPWQRGVVGVVYLGLAASLAVAMSATHIEKDV
jgi:hypothetical protein